MLQTIPVAFRQSFPADTNRAKEITAAIGTFIAVDSCFVQQNKIQTESQLFEAPAVSLTADGWTSRATQS